MKYITGIHALNLNNDLDTYGDWHQSGIQWTNPQIRDTDSMFFKDYGLEYNKKIPEHEKTYITANHIRALLDLLQEGSFSIAQGMKDDFICNDKYDEEIFNKVYLMKVLENWDEINKFMLMEYKLKWVEYLTKIGDSYIIK